MEISYIYTKKRKTFGKSCHFVDAGPHVVVDIPSEPYLMDNYVEVPSLEKEASCTKEMSKHEVETIKIPTECRGMNHEEGGWPADVDPKDDDQVARYKKKIEKDENYATAVMALGEIMEHYVMLNNTLEICKEYFADETEVEEDETATKIINVFRDYNFDHRNISDISWSTDGPPRLAVSYSFKEFQGSPDKVCNDSYVWELDNPNQPVYTLKPIAAINCIDYCPRDTNCLAGGYDNGQIALWDLRRKDGLPVEHTTVDWSHSDAVCDIKWINSKCGTEFISSSTDGKVMSWDTRNLSEPTKIFYLDPDKVDDDEEIPLLNKVYAVTCLEYDPSLPFRFMIGTEQGTVMSCNRKPKTPAEKIVALYETHMGPLFAVERNPYFPKHFATIGPWVVKVWSEDTKESPLLNLPSNKGYITDGSWSPTRPSVLFLTKTTGDLEIWDILFKQHEPTMCIKLEDEGLTCVRPNEQGDLVACGSVNGTVHLLKLAPSFRVIHKNEKNLMGTMLDREGKREKILETKSREQRLKDLAEEAAAKEAARLKELEINITWEPTDEGDRMYTEVAEYESELFSKDDLENDELSKLEELKVESEYGETEFLEELERDVALKFTMQKILSTVSYEVDKSLFQYKEIVIEEEFGEEQFLKELDQEVGSALVLESVVQQVSLESQSPLDNTDMPLKNFDLPLENPDLPLENSDLPLENSDIDDFATDST